MNGFSGLNQFATDVDSAIAEADRIAATPPPAIEQPSYGSSHPNISQDFGDTAIGRFAKTAGGWIAGIALILFLKFAIWGGTNAASDIGSDEDYDGTPYMETTDGYMTAEDSGMIEMPANEAFEDPETYTEDYALSDTDSYPTIGEVVDDMTSRPAPGTMQMTKGELRYCMEEMERLNGEQSQMESIEYIDVDRYNNNVDPFNNRLNDLRSVCGGNYRIADETAIEAELTLRRYSLQQEGRARVR